MAGPRALRSVLHNFLETLSSRYSDLDGFWIWGQVVGEAHGMKIDLFGNGTGESPSATSSLVQLARERFLEQLNKHRVAPTSVVDASLAVECVEDGTTAFVRGVARPGSTITLTATATSDGVPCTRTVSFVVAPHDPTLESRRAPAQRGWAR